MKLSQKDKSLLLFIAALFIIVWSIFLFLSSTLFVPSFKNSNISKIAIDNDDQWINVDRALDLEELKNRVILLDFWTYSCVSCIQSLPEIKKLEEKFGSKLTVIGIHSRKYDGGKDLKSIKKAILKYDITHPVINDYNLKIWEAFNAKSWPTYVLIDAYGRTYKTYSGEDQFKKINKDISKLISRYKYQINRDLLPIIPEKYDIVSNVLRFPTKLEYVKKFSYQDKKDISAIFIANTGGNNIIASSLSGLIITKIGSGISGLVDGSFEEAAFKVPQGLLYNGDKLYVADTGNNSLREVDFKNSTVSTLIGSGKKGEIFKNKGKISAKDFDLATPTNLEFFPDENHIAIANSGTHQILVYNIQDKTISVLAGNGKEGFKDGRYPNNSLAQTSDMEVFQGKLYFLDSGSSSLRVLDKAGVVESLIGVGIDKFGYKNGGKKDALMQYPLGLAIDASNGIFISDSFNHMVRRYKISSGKIEDFIGKNKRGDDIGSRGMSEFDEPDGIVMTSDKIYIADSNNNRIVFVTKNKKSSGILNILPPLKLAKENFLQYLPNLQKSEDIRVKSNEAIDVKINVQDGWKINEDGPSFVNLLELKNDNKASLISNFDWRIIRSREIKLPKLETKNNYVLQGVIYYCEDKSNALCYIKSYEQKIIVDSDEKNTEIEIKLGDDD